MGKNRCKPCWHVSKLIRMQMFCGCHDFTAMLLHGGREIRHREKMFRLVDASWRGNVILYGQTFDFWELVGSMSVYSKVLWCKYPHHLYGCIFCLCHSKISQNSNKSEGTSDYRKCALYLCSSVSYEDLPVSWQTVHSFSVTVSHEESNERAGWCRL